MRTITHEKRVSYRRNNQNREGESIGQWSMGQWEQRLGFYRSEQKLLQEGVIP